MKKRVLGLALAMLMGVSVLSGCGGQEQKADTQGNGKGLTEVRVAYMPNMGSASSLVAAMEQGYFEEQGLKVILSKFTGGPQEIAALNSGDIDIAQIGHGAHKLCIQGKAEIFQIDATSLADAVLGNAEKGVKTISDLKGKTIATTAGTSADVILDFALKEAGLTREDIKVQEMDADGVVPAMVSGQIDACATWSPSTGTILEKMGDSAVILADNAKYLSEATFPSSFIATKDYVEKNREILVKFSAAIQKGQDYRLANLDEVAKQTAKVTETEEQVMLNSKNEGNWETSGTEFIKKALESGELKQFYENQQKLFLEAGAIESEVNVDDYVHFDIMKDANELATK